MGGEVRQEDKGKNGSWREWFFFCPTFDRQLNTYLFVGIEYFMIEKAWSICPHTSKSVHSEAENNGVWGSNRPIPILSKMIEIYMIKTLQVP